MADYCRVYGVIHFTSPAGWLPVHRDQLRAQRSVTSMGKLYLFYIPEVTLRDWTQATLIPSLEVMIDLSSFTLTEVMNCILLWWDYYSPATTYVTMILFDDHWMSSHLRNNITYQQTISHIIGDYSSLMSPYGTTIIIYIYFKHFLMLLYPDQCSSFCWSSFWCCSSFCWMRTAPCSDCVACSLALHRSNAADLQRLRETFWLSFTA